MKGGKYIKTKQIQWAIRNGIALVGSKGKIGTQIYTTSFDDNLFESMSKETIDQFSAGDGGELKGSSFRPAKMRALHSSSAIGVNFFHYWKSKKEAYKIAHSCGLCSDTNKSSIKISFEQQFPISESFQFDPNIDVVIENDDNSRFKVFAIECKYSEAYGSYGHSGVDQKYFYLDSLWKDIPNTYELAKSISPDDNEYKFLHPAQLIKHILGLKKKYGKSAFRLLYLWYDVLGEDGSQHRNEIKKFANIAKSDKINFSSISYQEVIESMSSHYRAGNEKYINYISDRYL